jgi:hypothetical protein
MIWVAGRSPTLVSQNLKATTLTYLAIVIYFLFNTTKTNHPHGTIPRRNTIVFIPFPIEFNTDDKKSIISHKLLK